ncbi:MAG: proline--tRNA ligase [Acidobacteria bacterium]|nr:proline--tRNA ligase [Acidobacteriota bacterium]
MKWSETFIPTLREAPSDAEFTSHHLLLRAGYIRQLGAGIYSYLPLAQRVIQRITRIIREEMDRIGGQEFYLPALHPAEIWKESGRWEIMGENMFRLRDRYQRDLCLGMTHEEVFTTIIRDAVRSYKELPQIWYQIQVKFRDEPRPKSGLLRVRQFLMKDSYSFDVDWNGLDRSYQKHHQAYCSIFERCGLKYIAIQAHSGAMGGTGSEEFVVRSEAGEDLVVFCSTCGYAANREKASTRASRVVDTAQDLEPELVHTPGQKTIAQLCEFLRIEPTHQMKSVVYMADGKPVLVLVRGDCEVNEAKLESALGTQEFRPAHPDEIRQFFGADPGSLGPYQLSGVKILADHSLRGRKNLVSGANRDDYHYKNLTPGEDFRPEYFDLRNAESGDPCSLCGKPVEVFRAMEVGHIFKLGLKYSESMSAYVLNEAGRRIPLVMGSYGIGLERIVCAAIELYADNDGIVWPQSIAPFDVVISQVNSNDEEQTRVSADLYSKLKDSGAEVIWDDRNERPGVKFKDADLIGIPYRITVGNKIKHGKVEIFQRAQRTQHEVEIGAALVTLSEMRGGHGIRSSSSPQS